MVLFGGIDGGAPRKLPTPETMALPGLLLQIIPPVVGCDDVVRDIVDDRDNEARDDVCCEDTPAILETGMAPS